MKKEDIVRAWKDDAFRQRLTDQEHDYLPDHPAGLIDLDDADLIEIAGGTITVCNPSVTACHTVRLMCTLALCRPTKLI